MTQSQNEYYKNFADKLIEQLKSGTAPWQKPWQEGRSLFAHNPVSGTRYRGGNTIVLMAEAIDKGYGDSRWMTYEQAKSVGGQVRKGEKGTLLRFYKFSEDVLVTDAEGRPVLDENGKKLTQSIKLDAPKVISFVVFNASQINGLKPEELVPGRTEWEVNQRAERVLTASGARISFGGDRAYYSYQNDEIKLPPRELFKSDSGYYATALHEVGHWTGHSSRLDRDMRHPFGSVGYAKEELRAEIFSMMLGSEIGLGHDPGNHTAYVNSWIKVLQDDHREIFRAAADAEKIIGHVVELEKRQELVAFKELFVVVDTTIDMEINPGELIRERVRSQVGSEKDLQAAIEHRRIWSDSDDDSKGEFTHQRAVKISELSEPLKNELIMKMEKYPENFDEDQLKAIKTILTKPIISRGLLNGELSNKVNSSQIEAAVDSLFLNVPYKDRGEAKNLGAKWDKDHKSWYVPAGTDSSKFEKWLKTQEKLITDSAPSEVASERVFIAVPYLERNEAKSLGAKWDKDHKSWCVEPGTGLKLFDKWINTKVISSNLDPTEEFSRALKGAGLLIDGLPVMDGSLQRVQVEGGKHGNRDGAYTGHLDGRPSGYIENFKTGLKENWKAQGFCLSDADRSKLHAEAAQKLESRRKEQEEAQAIAADKASDFVSRLPKAQFDHSYLVKKGLAFDHGALINPEEKSLIVPASDIDGKVWSYQKISEDGTKSFAPGGRIEGCMFVATPSSLSSINGAKQKQFIENVLKSDQILVAEGFATAATLSEALNKSVIVSFSAGNLIEVSKAVRSRAPNAEIVICGDDDRATEIKIGKNPGKEKALAAADAVNGRAIFPKFAPGKTLGSDFNDLYKDFDLKTVDFQFRFGTASKKEITPRKEVKSSVGLTI